MPKDKNKKFKPIPYRDYPSSTVKLPQPKGKFVNPFKIMRDRQAAERVAEVARSQEQGQTPSNQPADTATHTHTETNPIKEKKKLKPIPYRYAGYIETLREPKGEFVDLFKVMQERAVARRAAKAARSRQRTQTHE